MLTENWRPWHTGLFLSAGLLFNGNRLSLQPRTAFGYYAMATPATATFHPVDPFLGIGWASRPFGGNVILQGEIGAAYQGRAQIAVQMGTGPYAGMAYRSEQASLQSAIGWRWLPVAEIGLRIPF